MDFNVPCSLNHFVIELARGMVHSNSGLSADGISLGS